MPSDLEFFHKEYDPEYAHWYYLQNRKLKGKKTGLTKSSPHRRSVSGRSSGSGHKPVHNNAQRATKSPKQLRSEADVRVASIKSRLNKLTSYLDSLMKKAIAEDDAKKSKSKDTKSTAKSSPDPKRTQQDKQADHQYYEKNKSKIASQRKKDESKKPAANDTQAEIDRVKAQIVKVRAELKAAIAKARSSTNQTKTAVKGR